MQVIHLKIGCFERGLSKSPKKVKFFFLSNRLFFNGKYCPKQERPGNSDQSLFRLQNKSRTKRKKKSKKIQEKFDFRILRWINPKTAPLSNRLQYSANTENKIYSTSLSIR